MKRHITCLICCTILLCAAALPARAAVAPKIAARTLDLGPRKGQTLDQVDTGLYSMHLGLDGKTLWLGRTHGVRKVDLATGNWKFFPSTACTGENITAMADTGLSPHPRAASAAWNIPQAAGTCPGAGKCASACSAGTG